MQRAGYSTGLLHKRRAEPVLPEDAGAIWDPPAAQPSPSPAQHLPPIQQQQQQQLQQQLREEPAAVHSAAGQHNAGPASTSQPQREGSTPPAAPRWRRQYIFCAATMPAGDGAKTKSITKVCRGIGRLSSFSGTAQHANLSQGQPALQHMPCPAWCARVSVAASPLRQGMLTLRGCAGAAAAAPGGGLAAGQAAAPSAQAGAAQVAPGAGPCRPAGRHAGGAPCMRVPVHTLTGCTELSWHTLPARQHSVFLGMSSIGRGLQLASADSGCDCDCAGRAALPAGRQGPRVHARRGGREPAGSGAEGLRAAAAAVPPRHGGAPQGASPCANGQQASARPVATPALPCGSLAARLHWQDPARLALVAGNKAELTVPRLRRRAGGVLCRPSAVMVCTDAAARGLDIPDVSHVVQADFASSAVDYLHRVRIKLMQGQLPCSAVLLISWQGACWGRLLRG